LPLVFDTARKELEHLEKGLEALLDEILPVQTLIHQKEDRDQLERDISMSKNERINLPVDSRNAFRCRIKETISSVRLLSDMIQDGANLIHRAGLLQLHREVIALAVHIERKTERRL